MTSDELDALNEMVHQGITFHGQQDWDFDLVGFCSLVEKLCRFLIQARENVTPGFLGPSDVYERWKLQNFEDEEGLIFDSSQLLQHAKQIAVALPVQIQEMRNSAGVAVRGLERILDDDPLGSFKSQVLNFVHFDQLDRAVITTGKGFPIDWDKVADWPLLPEIREVLDQIARQGVKSASNQHTDSIVPVAQSKSGEVKLFPAGTKPIALVRGHPIKKLTKQQHDVILALLNAGEKGLSKKELVEKSHRSDARGILRRLAESNVDWRAVIEFPGTAGFGYRLK